MGLLILLDTLIAEWNLMETTGFQLHHLQDLNHNKYYCIILV